MSQIESATAQAKYAAFISYRHADKAWGDWLHKSLEAYRVPKALIGTAGDYGPVPARLGRVFRDREELGAAHDLGQEIQAALRDSASLVVICSPGAARRRWVNEEILYWKRLGRADRVFPIIVDGEPGHPERECFPPALKYELGPGGALTDRAAEPLAADAREAGDGRQAAKLKLLAGVLGVDYEQLRRRDLEAQRRAFRRFAAIAVALTLVFAALAAAAGWFAYQSETQRAEAERQKALAERNLTAAISAANELIFTISDDVASTEGVQQKVLLRIQTLAQRLLDKLTDGQTSAAAERASAMSLLKTADARLAAGDTDGALRDAEAALAIAERLAQTNPSNAQHQHDLAVSHERIGNAEVARGDLAGALKSYEASLAIMDRLAEADPSNAAYQRGLSISYNKIGDVRRTQGDLAGALESYQALLEIVERLAKADPSNAAYQRDLAIGYNRIGDIRQTQGDLAGALASYEASREIAERLAQAAPSNAQHQRDLAVSHERIGDIRAAQGDLASALTSYEAALAIAERLAKADPSNADYQRDLAVACLKIASVHERQGDKAKAAEGYRRALTIVERLAAISPDNAQYRNDIAVMKAALARVEG